MTASDDVTISGDGAQAAFGNVVSRDLIMKQLTFVRGRPAMMLSEGEVADRTAGYVPALNHGTIVEALRGHHVAALCGPGGAGVVTTGVAALRELRPGLPIRLLSLEDDDVSEIGEIGVHGYLVRAADEQETTLRSCIEAVRSAGGYLLIVGTGADWKRFAGFLRPIVVQPPSAERVYRRRLEHAGFADTRWPEWPRAAELLRDGAAGDGRRLADLVVENEGADDREVEKAYLGWPDELRNWFTSHGDVQERSLMVAAAMIEPADETSVYGAALALARQLRLTVAGGGLAWHPSTGLAELLGTDQRDGVIVFSRQGYARSVLRHVWDEYPLTRHDLLSWLSLLPVDAGLALDPRIRQRLAETFADLAAEHGMADKILKTVEWWSDDRWQAADLSYVVLARTCLDPRVGGRVRRRLYQWSRERQAPQALRLTVARTCLVLGQTHTKIALTRLKHLASHGDGRVADEVFEVARDLAEAHPETVFTTAVSWCETAFGLPPGNGFWRIAAGLRIALEGTADGTPAAAARARRTVDLLGWMAAADRDELRPLVLSALGTLAVHHRGLVAAALIAWTANLDRSPFFAAGRRADLAAEAFLAESAVRDAAGWPLLLIDGPGAALDSWIPAWRLALAAETRPGGGYAGLAEAVGAWLDHAQARPDVRHPIVAVFSLATGEDPPRRYALTGLTREWADGRPERRAVRDAILTRIPQSEWQRTLLALVGGVRTVLRAPPPG
ncbi:hypothetical protein [Actinomadura parmotrematis]|uniref:Uncharacterized protein n=1 Tax=Actinomadura parmotrematis TaxID=2864039 RepID=A0ABS7G2M1_9ACTN|nr:hypothetical protein [Actinomadura parmotrematis]MBW8486072.1 hypothetical protein [Actinomadura parmotrematis]